MTHVTSAAIVSLVLFSALPAHAGPADPEWEALQVILRAQPANNYVAVVQRQEAVMLRYREAGVAFFEKHPQDPRRLEWLLTTLRRSPLYIADWGSVSIESFINTDTISAIRKDTVAIDRWENIYRTRLKPAFMSDRHATPELRLSLESAEMSLLMSQETGKALRGEKPDAQGLQEAVLRFGAQFLEGEGELDNVKMYARLLFEYAERFGFDFDAQRRLIAAMQDSPNPVLRRMGSNKAYVLAALGDPAQPFELRARSLEGRELDIAKLRGKVVVVDFWSTGCSSCIENMPHLKKLYERYRDDGLEVVGVVFNESKDRSKIMNLMDKMQIPWPQTLQGDDGMPLFYKLGFTGPGSVFLLDRQGTLSWLTWAGGRETHPLLEEQIRKLLKSG